MKSKNVLYLLAFCYTLGHYNLTLGDHVVVFPAYIFRAFGGLFLSGLVYALSEVIKPRIQSTRGNVSCIVFAQAVLGIVLCGEILAEQNTLFYIVCIFIGVTLILSAKQVNLGQRCGRIIAYLGKVSMVIYIVHVPMAYFLEYVGKMTGLANTWYLIALQLMSVLLVSCILYAIVEKVRVKLKLALDAK